MAEIRTILFASDLSVESDRAFEHARLLAERFRARLTVYHALELPRAEWIDATGERRARWAQGVRADLARRAAGLSVPPEIVVEGGIVGGHLLVDLALLETIHKTRPDLTVMATRGRKGFSSFFLGSVTQQVVQHAGRPVLCVRKEGHGGTLPYRRLLVPTDLSDASRRAFPLAALLARSFDAKVAVLHVSPPRPLALLTDVPGAGSPPVPTEDDVRRFLRPELDGVSVEASVYVTGAPWYRIVQMADEERADLIVMSTQGHDSVRDGIIGSNTERVLRHAPCSVLVA